MQLNANYNNLQENYLFATIDQKVDAFRNANPGKELIRLGIGDVTRPLCPAVVTALKDAADDMGSQQGFHGYGPYQGYDFIRNAICSYYSRRGVAIQPGEVYVNDGCKSDMANILDIFGEDNTVLIPDPVYPVYVDTNIMAGRKVIFMDANAQNGFLPLPDLSVKADIIYLCSPNNPTGAVYTKEMLQQWVDYAYAQEAIILFDAAYEAFIQDPALPRSIYEVAGAETCAIEFCSLSKTAGFTGTRCGYTIIPDALVRGGKKIGSMWLRRLSTKFNGVPYIVQRGAAAVFSDEGHAQIRQNIRYYMDNADTMAEALRKKNVWFTGGENSPYIWLKCPDDMGSWEFFDFLLQKANVVGTPGAGFGKNGESFFRLTAFGDREATAEAMRRIASFL